MTSKSRTKRVAEAAAGTAPMAGLYLRISDDRESEENGVVRQEEDGRKLAAEHGLTVLKVYSDNDCGASTKSRKPRPGYAQMLKDARAGLIQVIIAYSSSRLTRRPLELEGQINLAEQYGVTFLYLKSPSFDLNSADGRAVARTLAAWDAAEAERIAERVSRAAQQRAERGQYHGGGNRPFGFADNGVTIIETEAAEIKRMAGAVLAGVSLRMVAKDLRDREVPTVTGRAWSPDTVRQILIQPRIAGRMVNRGEDVGAAQWPAIVDPDDHGTIVARLTDPHRTTTTGPAVKWLGSGLYKCGKCLGPMRAHTAGEHAHRPTYRCQEGRGGGHVGRIVAPLDQYIEDVVIERLSHPDAATLFARPQSTVDVAGLRAEARRLSDKLIQNKRDYDDEVQTRAEYLDSAKRLKAKLTAIEAKLTQVADVDPVAGLIGADDVRARWTALPLGVKRKIVETHLSITVLPAGRGRGFNPDYVRCEWK